MKNLALKVIILALLIGYTAVVMTQDHPRLAIEPKALNGDLPIAIEHKVEEVAPAETQKEPEVVPKAAHPADTEVAAEPKVQSWSQRDNHVDDELNYDMDESIMEGRRAAFQKSYDSETY